MVRVTKPGGQGIYRLGNPLNYHMYDRQGKLPKTANDNTSVRPARPTRKKPKRK